MEEIKKREGFQLLLEVSEKRTDLLLLLLRSVNCLILFFFVNYQLVYEVSNLSKFMYWRSTDMTEHT